MVLDQNLTALHPSMERSITHRATAGTNQTFLGLPSLVWMAWLTIQT